MLLGLRSEPCFPSFILIFVFLFSSLLSLPFLFFPSSLPFVLSVFLFCLANIQVLDTSPRRCCVITSFQVTCSSVCVINLLSPAANHRFHQLHQYQGRAPGPHQCQLLLKSMFSPAATMSGSMQPKIHDLHVQGEKSMLGMLSQPGTFILRPRSSPSQMVRFLRCPKLDRWLTCKIFLKPFKPTCSLHRLSRKMKQKLSC